MLLKLGFDPLVLGQVMTNTQYTDQTMLGIEHRRLRGFKILLATICKCDQLLIDRGAAAVEGGAILSPKEIAKRCADKIVIRLADDLFLAGTKKPLLMVGCRRDTHPLDP